MTNGIQGEEQPRAAESGAADRRWRWPGAASTPPSATGPGDYAALEAMFLGGLGGVIALARRRDQQGARPIARRDLPVLALATFAMADVLAKEKVSTWLREPIVREEADHKPATVEGTGLRHAIGELLTCTRCVGTWSAGPGGSVDGVAHRGSDHSQRAGAGRRQRSGSERFSPAGRGDQQDVGRGGRRA